MQRRSANLKPALLDIGAMLEDTTESIFEKQGPGWKNLKKSTIAQRKKAGTKGKWPGKKLQAGGSLVNSISSQVKGNLVTIGSSVDHAGIHQFGGTINHPGGTKYAVIGGKAVFLNKGATKFVGKTKAHPIKIPARPYLRIGKKEQGKAIEILENHLVKGIK